MSSDERRAQHLEFGAPAGDESDDRLDLIRAVLADDSTWAEPPPGIYEAVAAETGAQLPRSAERTGRAWPWLVGAAAAAVLVLVGLAAAWGVFEGSTEHEPLVVAMAGTELASDARGTASLREYPSGWWIRLELEGLPPAPADTYYQGWVWRDGEGVSVGTFHMRGGNEPVTLWSGVDVAEYPSIWVTLQDEGGGAEASERVMMRGDITEPATG